MVAARTFSQAAYLSIYEFFAIYSPIGYVLSFVPRVGLQLAFFYLVAEFVGGKDLRAFLLVGNAAQLSVHTVLVFASNGIGRELSGGTLVLLLATPARAALVLTGRGLAVAANGVLTAAIGLAIALVAIGAPVGPGHLLAAAGLLTVMALSSYGLALALGGAMLRYPAYMAVASNLVAIGMMVLCGVTVPVEFMPAPLQALATILPLTHGLAALRALLAGGPPEQIVALVVREVIIGIGYLLVATAAFRYFLQRARQRGTLDFH